MQNNFFMYLIMKLIQKDTCIKALTRDAFFSLKCNPTKKNPKMILYRGHNKKSYQNLPESFHKPLHFTILSKRLFASFSTKTIK